MPLQLLIRFPIGIKLTQDSEDGSIGRVERGVSDQLLILSARQNEACRMVAHESVAPTNQQ